jgi:hypothetical protein
VGKFPPVRLALVALACLLVALSGWWITRHFSKSNSSDTGGQTNVPIPLAPVVEPAPPPPEPEKEPPPPEPPVPPAPPKVISKLALAKGIQPAWSSVTLEFAGERKPLTGEHLGGISFFGLPGIPAEDKSASVTIEAPPGFSGSPRKFQIHSLAEGREPGIRTISDEIAFTRDTGIIVANPRQGSDYDSARLTWAGPLPEFGDAWRGDAPEPAEFSLRSGPRPKVTVPTGRYKVSLLSKAKHISPRNLPGEVTIAKGDIASVDVPPSWAGQWSCSFDYNYQGHALRINRTIRIEPGLLTGQVADQYVSGNEITEGASILVDVSLDNEGRLSALLKPKIEGELVEAMVLSPPAGPEGNFRYSFRPWQHEANPKARLHAEFNPSGDLLGKPGVP